MDFAVGPGAAPKTLHDPNTNLIHLVEIPTLNQILLLYLFHIISFLTQHLKLLKLDSIYIGTLFIQLVASPLHM